MGRSYMPTYRVEYHDNPFMPPVLGAGTSMGWDCKSWGRPTKKNLKAWRNKMYESMKVGGCNEHVSKACGFVPLISKARIVRQACNTVVAEFSAPKFEVV